MRIIFLVHNFPPSIGGIPRRAFRLATELARRGHELRVYTASHPQASRSERLDGVKVERYELLGGAMANLIKRPVRIMPAMPTSLIHKDEVVKADVIQTFHFMSFVALVAAWLKVTRSKPYVISPIIMPYTWVDELRQQQYMYEKEPNTLSQIRSLLSAQFIKSYYVACGVKIIKYADVITPETNSEKNVLSTYNVDLGKITVIPGAIDVDSYATMPDPSSFRKQHSITRNDRLILFVGNAVVWKGTHHILLAMKQALKHLPTAKLVIVTPNLRNAHNLLARFASPSVQQRTRIVGPLEGDALVKAYAAADIFVHPSLGESFGTVILEAAAAGLPIISTKTGVAKDIVKPDRNGVFVEYGNVPQLSSAIIETLSNRRFNQEAEKQVGFILDTYNSTREATSFENVYQKIR